jgi:hypothetical protein
MHWETSRNQQRFSQIIENIVHTKNRKDREKEEDAKSERQTQRKDLTKPTRPTPSESSSRPGKIPNHSQEPEGKSATNTSAQAASKTDEDKKPQFQFRPIRTVTGLLKAQKVKKELNLSGRYPQVDQHGRVDLDAWLKEQNSEPRYRLGQYLLDAARLFEGMTSYRDRKLLETYLMKDPPMHPRRTLD